MKARTCDRVLIDATLTPGLSSVDRVSMVIALSSLPARATEDACRAVGIERWLAKPVLASELWTALDETSIARDKLPRQFA